MYHSTSKKVVWYALKMMGNHFEHFLYTSHSTCQCFFPKLNHQPKLIMACSQGATNSLPLKAERKIKGSETGKLRSKRGHERIGQVMFEA